MFFAPSSAPQAFGAISGLLSDIKSGLGSVLNVVVYVGVFLAAALYGASQLVPDPQERAKLQSWAWGAVLGAIGALLVKIVGEWILSTLTP